MTGILADLCLQLGSLALIFGGTIGALAVLEVCRIGIDEWHAGANEQSACGRISVDQLRGVAERLSMQDVFDQRAQRRR